MGWVWFVRRHGLISSVTLLIYLASLPPALWLFLNGDVTGSALLLLALGAVGAVLGTVVFTLFLARGCPLAPRPRIKPWFIWVALTTTVLVLYLYLVLTTPPRDMGILIASATGGLSLASIGYVVASAAPRVCAFIDIVLGHTVFAKSRGFRRFVHRLGYQYMIIAFVVYPLAFIITTPPVTIGNAVYILMITGFFLGVSVWAGVFTLALGIYLKHLMWVRKKPQ